MEKGWKAKGLLEPLYAQAGGRDKLAERSGLSVGHLSGVNGGGKDLGIAAARKLLAATTGFTLVDLGAPEALVSADPRSLRVIDHLREVEAEVKWLRSQLVRCAAALQLELEPSPQARKPSARSGGARR